MAKTQQTQASSFASATITAGSDGTGSAIDVRTYSLIEFQVKITSGATAPTIAPTFRTLASSDNTNFDADVNGMRYLEPISLTIPGNNATQYRNIVVDVTGISYIKPILKNNDATQAITGEILYIVTGF